MLLCYVLHLTAAFNVSQELQGDCSNQLTLICRHSETGMWTNNGKMESGQVLGTAFPGAMYTVHAPTKHTTTITRWSGQRTSFGWTYYLVCVCDATSSRAMLSSSLPFLLVNLETHLQC